MPKNIYQDIAQRTQGDIYIGVVGPVRTGKSTFIKKFMETLVIPNIGNNYKRERAVDELPQSAAGRTIMTTEPKFVPNEAVDISLDKNVKFSVRLIDCVGYIVPGSLGYIENDIPRMVMTPWFKEEVPFNMAAEVGTQKVIQEHSTIGLVVTTDGTIGEIPREDYIEAEERVVRELKAIDKPFIILLNSVEPLSEKTKNLAKTLQEKYEVPVMAIDCLSINEASINKIMETILFEFPVKEIGVNIPEWVSSLSNDHWLKQSIIKNIIESAKNINKIREVDSVIENVRTNANVSEADLKEVALGNGSVLIKIDVPKTLFYKVLGETTGVTVENDGDLMTVISGLAKDKQSYDKFSYAIHEANVKGYGIVTPTIDELKLEEPEIVRQGNRFGVKLKASAPSYHIIKANIETEVSPIVGSERQSEELIRFLLTEFEEDPKKIWGSNIFGKSLHELVNEGLHNKLNRMPEESREKMQETLQKIINEGSGGLICIIL